MKKADIITAILKGLQERQDELAAEPLGVAGYTRKVLERLERMLTDIESDVDIPTCQDFDHLGVECCPVCHDEPELELALIEIESGGKAWLCCALDSALNPRKRREMEQSPEWQTLAQFFQSET